MRTRQLDRVALAVLLPLWALCFALSVASFLQRAALPGVLTAAPGSPDEPPLVLGVPPPVAGDTDLRAGDRLLEVGGVDVRGTRPLELRVIVGREAAGGRDLGARYERAGRVADTPFPLFRVGPANASQRVASLVLVACAVVLLLRAGPARLARLFGYSFLSAAFSMLMFVGTLPVVWLSLVVLAPALTLTMPLAVRAAMQFPTPPARETAMQRWSPWLFAVHGPTGVARAFGVPAWGGYPMWAGGLAFLVEIAFFSTLLVVLTRRYRREDAIGRRQLRWILVGAWWACAPPVLAGVVAMSSPSNALLTRVFFASTAAIAVLPVAILLAIYRYNLFDVDRLLSATAAWNALLLAVGGVAVLLLPPAAQSLADVVGVDPATGGVVVALVLVASAVPAQRRLRPQIERVFFSERFGVDRGVERLLHALSACDGPQELTRCCGEGMRDVFRPESCAIYARGEADYVPLFAYGLAAPIGFEADGPLAAVLRRRRGALVLGAHGRPSDASSLGPFDRAALETLGAEVVLPVRRGDELRALVCLGPRQSGDVYTPTDVTLLTALVEKVSSELLRFDDAALLAEGREMAQALRRYVPGAIAQRLDEGRSLDEGEREVSVLFVDIRGYTAFAEARASSEVFASLSRYTEAVSRSVRGHGGTVVEFNGDGMMAVFGAPETLEDKERRAVEAGREILRAVATLEPSDAPVEVGVGIATGPAFVGNIRAVDRMIWSAVGTTTNTAARLQDLTRDLGAPLLIDETTRQALGPYGDAFVCHESVAIRGRSRRLTVYALPG